MTDRKTGSHSGRSQRHPDTQPSTPAPRPRRRVPVRALVGVLIAMLISSPGAAALTEMDRDRTDNTFYFSYEAATGTMPTQESAARYERDDEVTYLVYIRERPDAPPGERLAAILKLDLIGKEKVIYDGIFSVHVSAGDGTEVYSDEVDVRVVLRPVKGERKAKLRFLFDLPTGDYTALSRFSTP